MCIISRLLTTPLFWIALLAVFIVLTIINYKKLNKLKALNCESEILMIEIP